MTVANFAFSPKEVSVPAGVVVTWTNQDRANHTTTSEDKAWDSGPISPGGTFTATLTKPGTYAYRCAIHPGMRGSVTALPSGR